MNKKIKELILQKIFKNYRKKQINAIVLFGSRARGDFREDSDYDINVYISCKEKEIDYWDDKYHISFIDKVKLKWYVEKGHSFLFCAFRDGLVLYQNKSWFEKKKRKVMKLEPSNEIIADYLEAGLFNLISTKRRIHFLDDLVLEDIKVAANQIGFALIMSNKKYPISAHTLREEIKQANNKYSEIADIIYYFQRKHYFKEGIKKKCYEEKLDKIYLFGKKILKENFTEEYKEIRRMEKILLKNKI